MYEYIVCNSIAKRVTTMFLDQLPKLLLAI